MLDNGVDSGHTSRTTCHYGDRPASTGIESEAQRCAEVHYSSEECGNDQIGVMRLRLRGQWKADKTVVLIIKGYVRNLDTGI